MIGNWLELAIIAVIIMGIIVAIWKGGSANPEGTGSLGKKLTRLDAHVGDIDQWVERVNAELARLDSHAASKADIKRLERSVEAVKVEVAELAQKAASREATLDHVKHQVDRLYDYIVNKGMST